MIDTIEEYLALLKKELKGCDPALLQDALSDAEEYLWDALEGLREKHPQMEPDTALETVIEKYGSPAETAAAYKEIELRTSPEFRQPRRKKNKSWLAKFFAVLGDPRAWGAVLYMILSALTGLVFGSWTFLGMTISTLCMIFIFGIPIAALFLLSLRGIGLLEGRFVEASLGVRMPRKPIFVSPELKPWEKIKSLFKQLQTWKVLLYLLSLFPLGLFYSLLILVLLAESLSFILAPFLELVLNLPTEILGTDTFTPVWLLPAVSLMGVFFIPIILRFAQIVGRIHGRYAKFMLVKKEKYL
jgi:hypothetical protein